MLDSTLQKLHILGPSAKYDTCGPKETVDTHNVPGVYWAKVGGGVCRLFKVLQSNVCVNNCFYCVNRRHRNCPRLSIPPSEMAQAFFALYQKRLVDGLFLSSAIEGTADYSMTKMIETVTLLRKKYTYRGYVHLKIMPGSSSSLIEEAVNLSNRVSVNLEGPNQAVLTKIAPDKQYFSSVLHTLSQVRGAIEKKKNGNPRCHTSQTTQFVVGAAGESDTEIVEATAKLYKNFNLSRIFYSAFQPVPETPLSCVQPASKLREHRLYEADFLLRFYHFRFDDMPFDGNGNLLQTEDPKMTWAKRHPEFFPIEINKADYNQLLKIPGIGPLSAKKILGKRAKQGRFLFPDELRRTGIPLKRAHGFVTVSGKLV